MIRFQLGQLDRLFRWLVLFLHIVVPFYQLVLPHYMGIKNFNRDQQRQSGSNSHETYNHAGINDGLGG